MIIGKPGHGHYWQYMGEEEHVPHPTPESSYPHQREVPGLAGAREVVDDQRGGLHSPFSSRWAELTISPNKGTQSVQENI